VTRRSAGWGGGLGAWRGPMVASDTACELRLVGCCLVPVAPSPKSGPGPGARVRTLLRAPFSLLALERPGPSESVPGTACQSAPDLRDLLDFGGETTRNPPRP
jgi:hypothetical protein